MNASVDGKERPRIVWGITGSVATIRAPLLADALLQIGDVQAVVTDKGRHFLDPLPAAVKLLTDADEWSTWKQLGDPVLHIELRRWADLFVVAPCSADTMAKIAHGICDNLLLSVARAWDFTKPMLLAPAMNTLMWDHPATAGQLQILNDWGVTVIDPVEKRLACADVGIGALASPDAIRLSVEKALEPRRTDR